MREHEIVVALPIGHLPQAFQRSCHAIGQRNAADAAAALGRAELATDERLSDTQAACGPVDVAPAEREQLALAQSGHGCGEGEWSLGGAQDVVRNRSDDRLELGLVEVADVVRRLGPRRSTSRQGFVSTKPRRSASPSTAWRKATMSRLLFAAWPSRRLRRIRASTSRVVVRSSGRSPKNGAKWTRRTLS